MSRRSEPECPEIPIDQRVLLDRLIATHRGRPGALIPLLEAVQGITGYLPEPIQRYVARGLSIPLSRVYGVVTFYSYFTMKPRGRHQIRLCLGTACHVRGAQRNVDHIRRTLHIEPEECTPDRQFSLEIVRCLGACGLAPVLAVNDDIHKQMSPGKMDDALGTYRGGSTGMQG